MALGLELGGLRESAAAVALRGKCGAQNDRSRSRAFRYHGRIRREKKLDVRVTGASAEQEQPRAELHLDKQVPQLDICISTPAVD